MAKTNGEDLAEAIKKTNEIILSGEQGQPSTLDPILKAEGLDAGIDLSKNTDPYKNPAASHLDPVTSDPVGNNNSFFPGFGGANFGGFGGGSDDLPF